MRKVTLDTNFELNIVVYADDNYFKFVAPFIFFALSYNPKAHVEVILIDKDRFFNEYKRSIVELENIFKNHFSLVQDKLVDTKVIVNTRRFLHQSKINSDYIYIGDIDILIMEDLKSKHTSIIKNHKVPFSNKIRNPDEDYKRLTGLHFISKDAMYPLPNLNGIDLTSENDEHVLYKIMEAKGLMVPNDFKERPECGIHLSTSRDPIGRYHLLGNGEIDFRSSSVPWGGIKNYQRQFFQTVSKPEYQKLFPLFDIEFRQLVLILEAIMTEKFEQLEWLSQRFIIDNRIFVSKHKHIRRFEILEKVKSYVASRKFSKAKQILQSALLTWPTRAEFYSELVYVYLASGRESDAIAIFKKYMNNKKINEAIKNHPKYLELEKLQKFNLN